MTEEQETISVQAIFQAMDKLAAHPYEYWLSGIGVLLVIAGIFSPPWHVVTQEELWGLTGLGLVGLIGSFLANRQKNQHKLEANLAKLAYKKFRMQEKTRRLQLAQVSDRPDLLMDLEPL